MSRNSTRPRPADVQRWAAAMCVHLGYSFPRVPAKKHNARKRFSGNTEETIGHAKYLLTGKRPIIDGLIKNGKAVEASLKIGVICGLLLESGAITQKKLDQIMS